MKSYREWFYDDDLNPKIKWEEFDPNKKYDERPPSIRYEEYLKQEERNKKLNELLK